MSAPTRSSGVSLGRAVGDVDGVRAVALGGVGLLIASFVSVLYYFIDVTGTPATYVVIAAATLTVATALSRVLRVPTATLVGVGLLVVGVGLYVISLPGRPPVAALVFDALSLATGRTLLRVTNVDLWVLAVSPGPLFLTWYLALRRWYVTAVAVGGATLGFLVLTGDASTVVALVGVVGAIVAVAVGDMDRRGDSLSAAEPLAVVLAAMILLSGLAPLVPSGSSGPVSSWADAPSSGDGGTVEGSLVQADDQIGIQGDLSLSPEVRFRVESDESSYWKIGSYDRFTGDGWIRTGDSDPYRGELAEPPGESRSVSQTYTVVDELGVLPAAWKPVSVGENLTDRTRVTDQGDFELDGTLSAGESYAVESRVPAASTATLNDSGTDYPDDVLERYTGVPASTPDRVAERTDRLTERADTPYETARIVEQWLENNRNYSLDVEMPQGNIADEFLFEMDAGYCTYYATTMAVMLRSQDIPTRFVAGYTPGERVSEDEWVVRGYNAHAWVEAYFPDVGWVRFDPTPSSPRTDAERQHLDEAREQNRTDVDTTDTRDEEWTARPTETPAPLTPRGDQPARAGPGTAVAPETPPGNIPASDVGPGNFGITEVELNLTTTAAASGGNDGSPVSFGGLRPPTRAEATLGAIFLLGLVAGLRRIGLTGRAYRAMWLRYQPRSEPRDDAERAFERLEYLLADRYRPRRPGETPRQYLAAIGADERARKVTLIRERARYAGRITRDEADEAVALVDDIVAG